MTFPSFHIQLENTTVSQLVLVVPFFAKLTCFYLNSFSTSY